MFTSFCTYKEESNTTDIISQGEVLFRAANYEHSNRFSDKGGLFKYRNERL
jgi:hypothetical protein